MAETKRVLWADLVRIVAIYLVLVVHSSSLPQVNLKYLDIGFVTLAVAMTCVPLFVMVSGALLLPKKETYFNFFKKRFLRLVAPWVTWTIIYTAITIYTQQIYAFPKIARTFITQLEAFWFLPMIVGLYLLTPAIRIFVQSAKKRDIWLVIFLWFLVVSFLPFVDNSLAFPRQVDDSLLRQIVNYFGYFLLGYVLTDVKFYKSWILPCLFIFLGIFWTIFSVYNSSLYKGIMIKDLYTYISPGIVWLAIGIFMLIFKISKKKGNVVNKTGGKIIILLSTSALAIYFIHALVQRIFIIFFGTASLLPDIPFANFINGAILFATSFFILFILYQVPFVKRLIA